MVRCEEFYKQFEKKGNFCGKSENVVKKVETYINYIKRNDIDTYKISNCALDPFIAIEFVNEGKVHRLALKELKSIIKKGKILPEKLTRRMSIEMINKANNRVDQFLKLNCIPGIRNRMGDHEHEIGEVSFNIRKMFDEFKKDIGAKSNNQALEVMIELSTKNIEDARHIKDKIENDEATKTEVEIVNIA